MFRIHLFLSCCFTLVVGCADVAPQTEVAPHTEIAPVAPEADSLVELKTDVKNEVKAGIVTELHNRVDELRTELEGHLDAQFEVKGAEVHSKMTGLEAELTAHVDQRLSQYIDKVEGEVNVGPFSGGGFYASIVAVVVVVTVFVFLGFLIVQLLQWRSSFRLLATTLDDYDHEEHSRTVSLVKSSFHRRTRQQGSLHGLVVRELRRLGVQYPSAGGSQSS